MINEPSNLIIITWIVSLLIIVKITYGMLKDSKQSDNYFKSDDRIINDFYVPKKKP